MGCLGNIIWILCGGIWQALAWCIAGIFWCITVVGIPIGIQCFKFANMAFAPFGKDEYKEHTQLYLVYGKWNPEQNVIDYDEEKIHRIRSRNIENLRKSTCQCCEALEYCAGGCLGQALMETGNMLGKSEWNCSVTKYLFNRMPIDKGLYPITHS